MKFVAAIAALFVSFLNLGAADALYTIKLKNCHEFEVVSPLGWISVYPLSEGMQRVADAGSRKTILAADYSVGGILRTEKPGLALQAIVKQISEQTGRSLGKFVNSSLQEMAPSAMLMATDADSVWCLVLTPKGDQPHTYLLSCGFVIDRQKKVNQPVETTPVSAAH